MTDSRASVHIAIDPHAVPADDPVEIRDGPFELVIVGDLAGNDSRGAPALPRSYLIDRDDFDAVLAAVAPRIRISPAHGSPAIEIAISALDDFHPDFLFDQAPLFHALRDLRRRARDPQELSAVAAALVEPPPDNGPTPADRPAAGPGLLDRVLASTGPLRDPSPASPASPVDIARGADLSAIVRRLVAPHLVPRPDPRQAEVIASIDGAVSDAMRSLLHDPAFQAVEGLWRALHLLVRRLETDTLLRIRVVDLPRAAFAEHLRADTLRAILRPPAGTAIGNRPPAPPAVVVAAYPFSASDEDLALWDRLASLGRVLGAPVLVAGTPAIVGASTVDDLPAPESWRHPPAAWQDLRARPDARWLGVALPRFLLRLPYGSDGEECDSFDLTEMPDPPPHEAYLWGNPAIACALLLAEAYSAAGWDMRPGQFRDLDGLPLALMRTADGIVAQPCAEVLAGESAAECMLDSGTMPLLSVRDRGTIHLLRFQSIADPPAALTGAWAIP